MNKELKDKLKKITVQSTSISKKDKWTKDLAMFYFELFDKNEKGIYGMRNDYNSKIEYVGEAIDMTWRMYEHYHQVRGIGTNLKQSHNIADSFYRKMVPGNDINLNNAKDFLATARDTFTPVCLWVQKGDSAVDNGERLYMEAVLMDKYKPILNKKVTTSATKRSANSFTNELGRYE